MRLDKFICLSTELSRVQAVASINAGLVLVNGSTELAQTTQVHENNCIEMQGEVLKRRAFRYIVMHKPLATICSNVAEGYPSLLSLLPLSNTSELHIAGRLDVDTTGMVLITDDGRWTYNITLPTKRCHKVYRVGLAKAIDEEAALVLINKFKQGIQLQGESELTLPATLQVIAPKEVLLSITEGKYHQVKRMFAAVGNKVRQLHREQIGALTLDLAVGQWRYLSDAEVLSFMDGGSEGLPELTDTAPCQ